MEREYVHGYSQREHARLLDQASTLTELLHGDTRYPAGSRVLEAGCGVGAQTVTLARNTPGAHFTCTDVSPRSLEAARARASAASLENVSFRQADIFALPFPEERFDHVFVCFVLEHLDRPGEALATLRSRLAPDSDLVALSDYWTGRSRKKDILPILESVAETAGVRKIDIAHLLPSLARKLLYTYPDVSLMAKGSLPDCQFLLAPRDNEDHPAERDGHSQNHPDRDRLLVEARVEQNGPERRG